MALSNIFREPRREITETLLGIILAVALVWGDILLALSIANHTPQKETTSDIVGLALIIPVTVVPAVIMGWGLLMATHFLGEKFCDFLARRGLDPRPKQRH
jgi:undecaprenyl pyrophosphate phosphatase UppP